MTDSIIATGLAFLLAAQPATAPLQQKGQQQAKVASVELANTLPDAPSVQQPQQAQQQQGQIPDAPRPQGTLGPVIPGKGTTPTSNGSSGSGAGKDPDAPEGTQSKPPAPADQAPDTAAPLTPANSQEFVANPDQFTIINRVNAVEIPFTVKDNKGKLVPGLDWREVQVKENGVRQHMTVMTTDPWPLSVAVVVDQSLPQDVMTRVNNSLGALQGAFTPYDLVSVFVYNNGPKMITDFSGGQSARVIAAIERAKSSGREATFYDTSGPLAKGISLNGGANSNETPLSSGGPGSPQGLSQQTIPREVHTLNDAILMAAKSLVKAEKGRRRIIYVISDGKEYGSTAKQKDVIKFLQMYNIEVEATLVGDSAVSGMGFIDSIHLPLMMRDNALPAYTKQTGGQFYADYRQKGIEASFAKITEEARTQYTVWYNTQEPMIDGKFRSVEVTVQRPNLQVIAKKGYYPSPQDFKPNGVRQLSTPAMAGDAAPTSTTPMPAPQQ